MANRNWSRDQGTLEKGLVTLYAEVAIGATGAPTLSAARSKGIASITRNGAGDYTVAFADTYQRLVDIDCKVVLASGVPASPALHIKERGASSVNFILTDLETPAATDPASGEVLLLRFVLSNSTAL